MNNKEALKVSIGYPVDDGSLTKACIDRGISPEDEYSGTSREVDLATADILMNLLVLRSEAEGEVSMSLNTDGVKSRLTLIARKYQLDDVLDFLNEGRPPIRLRSLRHLDAG